MTFTKHQKRAIGLLACVAGLVVFILMGAITLGAAATGLVVWALDLAAEHRTMVTIVSGLGMFGSIFALMFAIKYLIEKLLDWRRANNKPSITRILNAAKEDLFFQRAGRAASLARDELDAQTPPAAADRPRARL